MKLFEEPDDMLGSGLFEPVECDFDSGVVWALMGHFCNCDVYYRSKNSIKDLIVLRVSRYFKLEVEIGSDERYPLHLMSPSNFVF